MISTIITYIIIIVLILVIIYLIKRAQKLNKFSQQENPNIIAIDQDNLKEKTAEGVVLMEFWAEWCKPCKYQASILNEVAEAEKDRLKVAKVDIDKNKELVEEYDIQNIPSIIIFKDGEVVQKLIGYKSRHAIKQALKKI